MWQDAAPAVASGRAGMGGCAGALDPAYWFLGRWPSGRRVGPVSLAILPESCRCGFRARRRLTRYQERSDQGRTVDTVIAAMEANHPHLTTQKSFYVEISRARDRAELVTDDKAALKEQLEAVEPERAKGREAGADAGRGGGREGGAIQSWDRSRAAETEKVHAPKGVDRDLGL